MAKLAGVFNTGHTPFLYMPPEQWLQIRAGRTLREDVPFDDLETNVEKLERVKNGFATLRQKVDELDPDVILIFGDDQYECFNFTNFPSFAVYVGEEFSGLMAEYDRTRLSSHGADHSQLPRATLKGHPELATGILTGVMQRGFDPAFCMDMPNPEYGVGHAILRPAESITDMKTPVIPLFINCFYAPQPTAVRCYEFGKAVREAVESDPSDLRVVAIGSGGLWHTPGVPGSYLNEEFDQTILSYLAAGKSRQMAEYFDNYEIPAEDTSQNIKEGGATSGPSIGSGTSLVTGMPGFGGPQGGTREVCNWIAAAGMAEGSKSTIVDYVPIYSSPIGVAFTYCTDFN
jgi:Catalytic LigB subunit of aromatic ring-opening dioxygenase